MRQIRTALIAALMTCSLALFAQEQASPETEAPTADDEGQTQVEAFLKTLTFQSGTVALKDAGATLNLTGDLRYLSGDDAERVLTQLWGNPPGTDPLGMIVPSEGALAREDSYAVVLTYNDEGYVSDEDAGSIDYDKMLKEMQEGTAEENKARKQAGYGTVDLVGWATRPRYDGASKKLYWAKELRFEGSDQHVLNYDVRVLGRRGYLSMNAVAGMSELGQIEAQIPTLLSVAEFDTGARYADYNAGTDKLAAYGLGALVAGGVAAKAGLFSKLLAFLVFAKKFLIIGLVGVAALARKYFFGKKNEGGASGS